MRAREGSEGEPEAHLDLPFRILCTDPCDPTEGAGRDVAIRVGVDRVVEQVAGLQPVLDPLLPADRERAEEREVQVPAARAAELVAAGIAEAHARRLCELRGIEPRA